MLAFDLKQSRASYGLATSFILIGKTIKWYFIIVKAETCLPSRTPLLNALKKKFPKR